MIPLWKLRLLFWDTFFSLVGYPPPFRALNKVDKEIYRRGLRLHNDECQAKVNAGYSELRKQKLTQEQYDLLNPKTRTIT